ncbi:hypothetical protein T12_1040 [Trichinella patagoniensis]|uniref:Uncharacterized protein n=1 Tax=Trichinella patagoniensis TaxID=990121 RepID=A0A0V0ZZE8_9BILA|nr:hypothetical protein T12_1040 [Trichinella patagoniensis]
MKSAEKQNSQDLNTAYTCDRYQQALLQHRFLKTKRELTTISTYLKSGEHRKHEKKTTKHIPPKMQNVTFLVLKYWKRLNV